MSGEDSTSPQKWNWNIKTFTWPDPGDPQMNNFLFGRQYVMPCGLVTSCPYYCEKCRGVRVKELGKVDEECGK